MTDNQESVSHFIRLIRGISPQYLRYACTHGGCYRFFLVLRNRFPSARPYKTWVDGGGHVVARIYGRYWDVWGEHDPKENGAVKRFSKLELERMSSCIFDEGFALQNTRHIIEYDQRAGGNSGG